MESGESGFSFSLVVSSDPEVLSSSDGSIVPEVSPGLDGSTVSDELSGSDGSIVPVVSPGLDESTSSDGLPGSDGLTGSLSSVGAVIDGSGVFGWFSIVSICPSVSVSLISKTIGSLFGSNTT